MEEEFKTIKKLELELIAPNTRKDSKRLEQLLSDDFQEFGKSGKIYNKAEIIAALCDEEASDINFSNFNFTKLGKDNILVTYKSSCNGINANRSSIWNKNNK